MEFPIMINMIRDPVSQFISNYYYVREEFYFRQTDMSDELRNMVGNYWRTDNNLA